ncbi:MAG: NAD-dependent epimerase/dehydratase family protein [Euryarchaeota archaeon]|nr:NAD-dependent epimerase/dehydratase family protein [Euryarchaeota archaeon]
MTYFVTGGAGFIGSNVVDRLAKRNSVTVYDNLSTGKEEFISEHLGEKYFRFVKADLLDVGTSRERCADTRASGTSLRIQTYGRARSRRWSTSSRTP